MKRLITLLSLAALVLFGSGFAHAVLGIDMAAAAVGMTAIAFFTPTIEGSLMMAATTDVDAIAKWAGMYSKKMLNQMLNGLDIMKDLKADRLVTRHGKLLPKFEAFGGMRPLDVNVEENGRAERKFSGRKLYVYDMMKLFKIVPEEQGLLDSFMSDMIAPGAKQIPFAQWVWQKEMEKLASEINDNFYLQVRKSNTADYNAGTTYGVGDYIKFTDDNYYRCIDATTAGQSPVSHAAKWVLVNHLVSFDGFAKIIADEITASNITGIVTGAISNSNALDKIELMYKDLTIAHRNAGGVVRVSYDVYEKYLTHEKTVYPNVLDQKMGDMVKTIYGSGGKWVIKPATWMGTSQRIIFDVKAENLVVGTNITATPGVTKTVETLHGYKSVAKWLLGCQISDLEVLYVNDQA